MSLFYEIPAACRHGGQAIGLPGLPLAGSLQALPSQLQPIAMRKPGNVTERPAPSFLTQEQREALDAALSKKRAEQRESPNCAGSLTMTAYSSPPS